MSYLNIVQKQIKNVLFVICNDLKKLDEVKTSYNYFLTVNDLKNFDEGAARIYQLCLKYKEEYDKLTDEILKRENATSIYYEYFREFLLGYDEEAREQLIKKAEENFKIHVEDIVSLKARCVLMDRIEKLKNEAEKIYAVEMNAVEKISQTMSSVWREILALPSPKKNSDWKTMADLHQYFEKPDDELKPIPTGIKDVDAVIGGWKRKGVNLLSGPSNHGKTTFAIQSMVHAVMNLRLKALYINTEMTEHDIYAKILGMATGDGYKNYAIDQYDLNDEKQRLEHGFYATKARYAIEAMFADRLRIDSKSKTTKQVLDAIKQADYEGFDLVFIDYFQNVDVGDGKDNKIKTEKLYELQNAVLNLVRQSKKLAVVWLTQLNEDQKQRPIDWDISWCKALYKSADLEIRIWRPYLDHEARVFEPKLCITFRKTRFIDRIKPLEVAFDGATGRIGEFDAKVYVKVNEANKNEYWFDPDAVFTVIKEYDESLDEEQNENDEIDLDLPPAPEFDDLEEEEKDEYDWVNEIEIPEF